MYVPGQRIFAIRHLQGAVTLTGHSLETVMDLFPADRAEAGVITTKTTCLCPLEAAIPVSRNFPPPSNLPQVPQESICLWAPDWAPCPESPQTLDPGQARLRVPMHRAWGWPDE